MNQYITYIEEKEIEDVQVCTYLGRNIDPIGGAFVGVKNESKKLKYALRNIWRASKLRDNSQRAGYLTPILNQSSFIFMTVKYGK